MTLSVTTRNVRILAGYAAAGFLQRDRAGGGAGGAAGGLEGRAQRDADRAGPRRLVAEVTKAVRLAHAPSDLQRLGGGEVSPAGGELRVGQ